MAKLIKGDKAPPLPGFKPVGPQHGSPVGEPPVTRPSGPDRGSAPLRLTVQDGPAKAVHSNPPTPAAPVPSAADLAQQRTAALAAARVEAVAALKADRAAFGLLLATAFSDPRVAQVGLERSAGEWYVGVASGPESKMTWWYGATLGLALLRMTNDLGPAPKEG